MKLVWDENAWEDYLWWQAQDRKTVKRINLIIRDIVRNGNEGIDFAHRLVYKLARDEVRIAACRYHYGT